MPIRCPARTSGQAAATTLAIVILGGLLSSTFLNMLVLPVLFKKFASRTD